MLNFSRKLLIMAIPKILIIIPARGGSRGIPRKNLRSLAGKPLIFYSINNALKSKYGASVYVSSDDEEILSISEKLGANVVKRPKTHALDAVTLDPAIHHAVKHISKKQKTTYDIIVTLQPTSPLLTSKSLDEALDRMLSDDSIGTIISAADDTHLTWKDSDFGFIPNYTARVNRQQLAAVYKETGGFLISRSEYVTEHSRIGGKVDLYLLTDQEAVDIDSIADWGLCEYYLRKKRVLFVVAGHREIGLGHVYNTLIVANDIVEHEILFLVDKKSQLAFDKLSSYNYTVLMQTRDNILDDIAIISPEVVINDCLDTSAGYIRKLKEMGCKVVNFEDLGDGAKLTDLTVNAIYPEKEVHANHYYGYNYYLMRDEFILSSPCVIKEKVTNVLLTFGGVDPNNYTATVLKAIREYCKNNNISIKIVAGFGYSQYDTLTSDENTKILRNVSSISDQMRNSDIVFTSAGRTTYEVAALGVPTIVMAQNKRELTHFFASRENGFMNLGLGLNLSAKEILDSFINIAGNFEERLQMSKKMTSCNLSAGRTEVKNLVNGVINL